MPHQGPRRLPAGERDRRLAEEVLYLHSLWRRGGPTSAPAPAPAPIQPRSDRREEIKRLWGRLNLNRALRRKERKRRKIDHVAAAADDDDDPALAPPPPTSSPGILAEADAASAPPTANPPPSLPTSSPGSLAEAAAAASAPPTTNSPPPTTPSGPLAAQREAVPPWAEFTNRDPADDYDDREEEEEAARYFTGLFQREAWRRRHYTLTWRRGRFQCMVCAAAGGGVGKAVRQFRGCLALVQHAHNPPRSLGHGRYGCPGAHRALAAVVCRLLGWDIEALVRRRIVIDPRAAASVRHAKENDGAGENNSYSTDEDSYSIDEDEDSDDEESMDEEEGIETDPATDGDEEDSEIESDEEYDEKEDRENRMEDSSTDGDEDADVKEAANSISRKRDTKMLSLTHAKPVDTTPKKMVVQKRSHLTKHEVSIPGIKFNEGSDKAKQKASALAYQGLKSSTSGVVKKVKVNQQPSNKGKQSKANETGASACKTKRPAVAARKAKQLAKKKLAKKQGGCLNS